VPNPTPGRHRAPGAPSPVCALSSAVARSARPIGKVSAALAVAGGLVASFALPASASPVNKQAEPAAAPAPAAATPALDAVAVSTATSSRAAVVSPTFGEIGFTGVVKAKPKPRPRPEPAAEPVVLAASVANVERAVAQPSRSTHRSSLADTTSSTSHRATRHRPTRHRASSAPAPQRRHVVPPAPQAPASSGVLGVAAGLAGIPYVYGGTTPAGFDCSGFTRYVFAKAGKSLPRTAEGQRAAATPVSNPQPGDLVFFGAPAYHVGIYAGGGTMWDSPRTGKTTARHSIWSSNVTYGRP
jgi:peptidoglycan DL-endopeptidase CwlO